MKKCYVFVKKKATMRCMFLILSMIFSTVLFAQGCLPKLNTSKIIGRVDGVNIEAKVQSPSGQQTPLQIVCLFEYTEGDIFNPPALPKELNGMVHVDEALYGLITALRKSGKFSGYRYETLLIDPPANTIPANKLLLVGLGNRNNFEPAVMETEVFRQPGTDDD